MEGQMVGLNEVILMGNLTRDPDLRQTSRGTSVCNLGLAVNRRFTTSAGEDREETCFVDIDVWAAQAESCANYLRKGSPVLVEGRLRFNEWQDRETGDRRTRLTVQAQRVQFLGPPAAAGFDPQTGRPERPRGGNSAASRGGNFSEPASESGDAGMPDFGPIGDDDSGSDPIPF